MEQKRTWLYCRVAHDGPDTEGILDMQRLRLTNYAKEHRFEIVGCSSDIGSGLTLDRPGLMDFYTAAENGRVDVLLLRSLSRLGRNHSEIIEYWRYIGDLGVSIYTADYGKIDLSFNAMLYKTLSEMIKSSR